MLPMRRQVGPGTTQTWRRVANHRSLNHHLSRSHAARYDVFNQSVEIGRIICILTGVVLTYDHFSLLCRMLLCVRDRFVCAFVRRPYIPQTQSLGGRFQSEAERTGFAAGIFVVLV
jgi:hypothetical protein